MDPNHISLKRKIVQSIVLAILTVGLLLFPNFKIPLIDTQTEQYFNDAIQKAGIAYATVRVLNASISVIQNSQLQLEPAGVGMSVAVGQVVDPIDDMTERLSDILVTAIASLGIQRLIYEMAVSIAPPVLIFLCVLLLAGLWIFKEARFHKFQSALLSLTALILVGRFFLPVSAFINASLYERYFLDDITEARKGLMLVSEELGGFQDIELPEIDGFSETVKNSTKFLEQAAFEIKKAVLILTRNMAKMIENLLTLTWLYAGIFFIQVIVLPVLMFWFLTKLANGLLLISFPFAFRQPNTVNA